MRDAARAKWIAQFDMEPLISAILRNGTLLTIGLIAVSLGAQWLESHQLGLGSNLRAQSLPRLIQEDLRLPPGTAGFWPVLFMHLGISALLLTPYLQVLVCLVYFAWVERSGKQALFSGLVFIILTIILLTDWA